MRKQLKEGHMRCRKQEIQKRRHEASCENNNEEQFQDKSCVPDAEVTSSDWSQLGGEISLEIPWEVFLEMLWEISWEEVKIGREYEVPLM